jgi:Uncharacterized protein conserved in bacteria (DUF2332)
VRCDYAGMMTAAIYAEFAARETRGVSPLYERLSVAVSRDDDMLALLGKLPPARRQPNLLFGVARFLGGPVEDPAAFHDYAMANWPAIEAELRTRTT